MTSIQSQTVIACFESLNRAYGAVPGLRDHGVAQDAVSVLAADSARARQLLEDGPGSVAEAASVGSVVGGALSGLAAVALATSPFAVLAVGPIAALLAGAAAGAGAGGLLGALVGLGIPEHEAALRLDQMHEGGALVACDAGDRVQAEALRQHFRRRGAAEVFGV